MDHEQKHLSKIDVINQGSFYTPDFLVKLVYDLLSKISLNTNQITILDSSCGYGSFLNVPNDLRFSKVIGVDIDNEAISIAKNNFEKSYIQPLFLNRNSLSNVSRQTFDILESSNLIIVGNPPYNDKGSIVQRKLKNSISDNIDDNLKARDIGISFLRSYNELKADYVCVLHPLSYLIKKTNFKSLKNFTKNYILQDSIIISSEIFCPKSIRHFPIIIALYKRDNKGMDYDHILNYIFKTIEGKNFKLNDFDYICNYIDKYPNKSIKDKVAMFYTLRDINALYRSQTFMTKDTSNTVYVTKEKYSLYCYVDIFKRFIKYIPYYFGNCDVLIDFNKFKEIENEFVKASETKSINNNITKYFKNLLGEHYRTEC